MNKDKSDELKGGDETRWWREHFKICPKRSKSHTECHSWPCDGSEGHLLCHSKQTHKAVQFLRSYRNRDIGIRRLRRLPRREKQDFRSEDLPWERKFLKKWGFCKGEQTAQEVEWYALQLIHNMPMPILKKRTNRTARACWNKNFRVKMNLQFTMNERFDLLGKLLLFLLISTETEEILALISQKTEKPVLNLCLVVWLPLRREFVRFWGKISSTTGLILTNETAEISWLHVVVF